jgi:hypothetical protein
MSEAVLNNEPLRMFAPCLKADTINSLFIYSVFLTFAARDALPLTITGKLVLVNPK